MDSRGNDNVDWWAVSVNQHRVIKDMRETIEWIEIVLIRLTHADASARTMGIPEQSRSAPLEG